MDHQLYGSARNGRVRRCPFDALPNQFEMEALSEDPILRKIIKASASLTFGWPLDPIIGKIKERIGTEIR